MDWKSLQLDKSAKIFKVHNFVYMKGGANFHLEVNEYLDGTCMGYGEHSTDRSNHLEAVNGQSTQECLEKLIQQVEAQK